jgi:hypothetical protein
MDYETVNLIVGRAKVCKKIRATAIIEYDIDQLVSDLEQDYPEEKFTEQDAIDMIHKWIKDDFENTLAEVRIEEING